MAIKDFSKEYSFLSNFYPSEVEIDGMKYPTVEHAYQAAKTFNSTEREMILKQETPGKAKRAGKKVHIRLDWEGIKISIMYYLVRQKFKNDVELKNKLMNTENEKLVEGNTWGDTFWGVCRGVGENHLGKVLMKIRGEIEDGTIDGRCSRTH